MTAVVNVNDEKIQYDCLRFHKGFVSIRTRRRHHKEISMIDPSNNSPLHGHFQFDTLRNDGYSPRNISSRSQITVTSILEEADHDRVSLIRDFDD